MEKWDLRARVGAILPKDPIKLTSIKCSKEIIKEEIEQIANLAFYNLESGRWTPEDYEHFRHNLTTMDIKAFKSLCPEIISLMTMPKKCLQVKLVSLTNTLGINTFSDERITIEVPVKKVIDGKEVITKEKKYKTVPHQFKVGDLVSFLNTLYAYISRNGNTLLQKYQSRIDACKSTQDKLAELNILYESLNNNDENLITLIKQDYQKWYEGLANNDSIKLCLDRMFPLALDRNRTELRDKIAFYKKEEESPYNSYLIASKNKVFNKIAATNKKKTYKTDRL